MSYAPARVSRLAAQAFIKKHHRHNPDLTGDRWRHGCWDVERGILVGVACVGRPVAPALNPWKEEIVEITRVCTDGSRNACTWLYARAAQAARLQGFRGALTYTQRKESGASLRALGWWPEELEERGNDVGWQNRPDRSAGERTAGVRWVVIFDSDVYHAPEPLEVVDGQAALAF